MNFTEIHSDAVAMHIECDLYEDGDMEVSISDVLIAKDWAPGDTPAARLNNARAILARLMGHVGNAVPIHERGLL